MDEETFSETFLELHHLKIGDEAILSHAAEDCFDEPVQRERVRLFLSDPTHHLIVAVHEGEVVGQIMAFIHRYPYKPPQLYVDNLGVTPALRRRGVACALLEAMFALGKRLGREEAWLATEEDNLPARKLYESYDGITSEPAVAYLYRL